jgi:PBP1b-binding outer membrane lipoprotein LpoB
MEEFIIMKKIVKATAAVFAALVLFASCSSNPKITRVDAGTQVDLSGQWNDTDVRIVCDSLIQKFLESPRAAQEIARLEETPRVLVLDFANNSDEHITTSIISSTMEVALFNSGKLDFVVGGSIREKIRAERQDQQSNASEETAAALGKEAGANFVLTGSVETIIDRAGNTATRTYFVKAAIIDVATTKPIWMDQNNDIKKVIQTPRAKL